MFPTTAGNLLPDVIGRRYSRDGHISSIVTLKTAVGILVVLMYIRFSPGRVEGLQLKYDIVQIIIIVFIVISICIYLFLIVYILCFHYFWTRSYSKRKHLFLKMSFIAIFTPCNIAYLAMKVSIHLTCKVRPENKNSLTIHIIYECFFIVFLIFQMIFLCMSSGKNLYRSCLTHYAATTVIASNVAIAFYNSVKNHFEEVLHHSDKLDCSNQTTVALVYESTKLYLEPTVIENSLLCILVLKEIFTRSQDNEADNEITAPTYNIKHKILCIILLSIAFIFPYFLLKILLFKNRNISNNFYLFQACAYAIVKLVMYLVLIKCFHLLAVKGTYYSKSTKTSLKLSHYLILFSAFGSEIFFGINFVAAVSVTGKKSFAVNNILQFITTYVQTVLILQMKDYKTIDDRQNAISISGTFLFLSSVNFGLWLYDTFLETEYFDKHYYTAQYYRFTTTIILRDLFVPIVIFYRFKCFISFFKLSAFTPPFVKWFLSLLDMVNPRRWFRRRQN